MIIKYNIRADTGADIYVFNISRMISNNLRAKPGSSGVPKDQQEGAHSGETQSQNITCLYQPELKVQKQSDVNNKNEIHCVEDDEGDHQHQDGVGGSGLWGAAVGALGGVNMLHPLVMSAQETHHGAAGPDHEDNKHGIWTR